MKNNLFQRAPATGGGHPRRSVEFTMMEENITVAEPIITKWDVDGSAYARITSLFYQSDRDEAAGFVAAVASLRRALAFFVSSEDPSKSDVLARGNRLMEMAMNRLKKEFYQILSAKRERLFVAEAAQSLSTGSFTSTSDSDVDSLSEDGGEAVGYLREIAECMVSAGYTKECVKLYKLVHRSTVDEALYRVGFDQPSASRIQKLDWESVEERMRKWHSSSHLVVRTLFAAERSLADSVFGFSDAIKEACFSEATKEAAEKFFAFPSVVAGKPKKSPEKVFGFLDMYVSLSQLLPEIETLFSNHETTSSVSSRASASLLDLREAIRSMLSQFETAIQMDSSKKLVPGGGLHPLTRYVMNYLLFLGEHYDKAIGEIYAGQPLPKSPLLNFFQFTETQNSDQADVNFSSRTAWLLLVLLCKLNGIAGFYKNTPLSYLFLANNLSYVTRKVRDSKLLHGLLGTEWLEKNEEKVGLYLRSYERASWSKVVGTLPEESPARVVEEDEARRRMREFEKAFDEACRTQCSWVVTDGKMRETLKRSVEKAVVGEYCEFYAFCTEKMILDVRFSPEDVCNCISDLFGGKAGYNGSYSGGSVTSGSLSGSSRSV